MLRILRVLVFAARGMIAIGLTVITGWVAHIIPLTTFSTTGVPMVMNTAVCVSLAGIGFLAAVVKRSRLATCAAGIVGVFGLLAFFQEVTGWKLGLDNLLWTHPAVMPLSTPGRTTALTAIGLILLSFAIVLLAGKKPRLWP